MYKRMWVSLDGAPTGNRMLPYVWNLEWKLEANVGSVRVFDEGSDFSYPKPFIFQDRY